MDVSVRDNAELQRFEILVDGHVSGFADYRRRDGAVAVVHSEVDPSMRGRGLGGELARQTLDAFRERGDKVVPSCPFFAQYVAGHPEYEAILAG